MFAWHIVNTMFVVVVLLIINKYLLKMGDEGFLFPLGYFVGALVNILIMSNYP